MFVHIFSFKVSATISNLCEIFCSTEWFQRQQEFTSEIENMEVEELNKCLAKFYVRKTGLLSIRAPSTDILKPENRSKICLFFILFSQMIINVIILKQLVASGDVNIGE